MLGVTRADTLEKCDALWFLAIMRPQYVAGIGPGCRQDALELDGGHHVRPAAEAELRRQRDFTDAVLTSRTTAIAFETVQKPDGSLDIYAGADDNASGVAGLLEIARVLAAGPPPARCAPRSPRPSRATFRIRFRAPTPGPLYPSI